jgi:hypothetical protein
LWSRPILRRCWARSTHYPTGSSNGRRRAGRRRRIRRRRTGLRSGRRTNCGSSILPRLGSGRGRPRWTRRLRTASPARTMFATVRPARRPRSAGCWWVSAPPAPRARPRWTTCTIPTLAFRGPWNRAAVTRWRWRGKSGPRSCLTRTRRSPGRVAKICVSGLPSLRDWRDGLQYVPEV